MEGDSHLAHVVHNGVLLRADEALQGNRNGHVNVVVANMVAQVHPRVRLAEADNALHVTHGNGNGATQNRLSPKVRVEPGDLVVIKGIRKSRPNTLASVHDIFAQHILREDLFTRKQKGEAFRLDRARGGKTRVAQKRERKKKRIASFCPRFF
jgi:hypothetical protein